MERERELKCEEEIDRLCNGPSFMCVSDQLREMRFWYRWTLLYYNHNHDKLLIFIFIDI